ncbi:MAG: HIT domain-containing protein [Bdellovibrionales bacterium]|nr:HIT domain-containing protein [Bdellovibrionales bacterium]
MGKASKKKSSPKSSKSPASEKIEQWPKRVIPLFRPKRAKYIRGLQSKDKGQDCVFCEALAKGKNPESLLVHTTKHAMVVLNKFPYNTGHVLVLPKQHCGDVQALSDEEYTDLTQLLKKSMGHVSKVYEPAGMNVGLNVGKAAGAGIPDHLHFHIVPRWKGDLNFFSIIGNSKTQIEELSETYKKLRDVFDRSAKS